MSTAKHSLGESLFRFFLVLLLVVPLMFVVFHMLVDLVLNGSIVSILLLMLALAVCVQFKGWIGRLAALIFVFCILPNMVGDFLRGTNGLSLLLGFAVLSVAAYFIRARQLGHKERVVKTSGVERTPVLPPGAEE